VHLTRDPSAREPVATRQQRPRAQYIAISRRSSRRLRLQSGRSSRAWLLRVTEVMGSVDPAEAASDA
jgi:hypothetical protein